MTSLPPRKVMFIGLDAAVPTLIEEFSRQGILPNLAHIMKNGVYSRVLPVAPANTPPNWATLATGCYPGTHGYVGFDVHEKGTPLDECSDGFWSHLSKSEFIWETAARAGLRSIVMNYPCSTPPPELNNLFYIGGTGSPFRGSVFEIKQESCYASPKAAQTLTEYDVISLNPSDSRDKFGYGKMLEGKIEITPTNGKGVANTKFRVFVVQTSHNGFDKVIIVNYDDGSVVCELEQRGWSNWIYGEFILEDRIKIGSLRYKYNPSYPLSECRATVPRQVVEGSKWAPDKSEISGVFRFKLIQLSPDGEELKLYCSQVFPTDGFTQPGDLSQELIQNFGPYIEYTGTSAFERGWIDPDTVLENAEYKGIWMAKVAKYMFDTYNCNLLYCHWHFLDHIQHLCWNTIEPMSGSFSHKESGENVIVAAYKIADRIVGEFLSNGLENVAYIIISDHGIIPYHKEVSINNVLAREGLIDCRPGPEKPIVNWAKTKAYVPTQANQVYINLKGRDPQGTVKPSEYKQIQEEVIHILKNLRDPENGNPIVSIALRGEDAAVLGQWGGRAPDVFFLLREGYSGILGGYELTNEGNLIRQSRKHQAAHGYTLMTTRYGRGTELAVLVMGGSGVKRYRNRGLINMVDIAPTVCYLLGISPRTEMEGSVLIRFLNERKTT